MNAKLARLKSGEHRELSDVEIAGLQRTVIAVNAVETNRYMTGVRRIHPSLLNIVHSLKIPREAEITHYNRINPTRVLLSADQLVAELANNRELPQIMIDSKFSNDGKELVASVKGLHTASSNFLDRLDAKSKDPEDRAIAQRLRNVLPPGHISFLMHHMVDPAEIKLAADQARRWFEPIAMVSSSKQDKKTNERYGLKHKDLTVSMARMALDAGITHLTVSANDASMVRDAISDHEFYDSLLISGTGAVLNASDIGEHDATISVDEVRHAVDFFVLGRAVLLNPVPDEHLLDYARAIGPKN